MSPQQILGTLKSESFHQEQPAHRFSTIQQADKILVLKNGRIVEQGKYEVLIKKGIVYQELYWQQFMEWISREVGLTSLFI